MTLIRLNEDDWKDLLPGRTVKLGKTIITIEPLGIADLARLTLKCKGLYKAIRDSDIDLDNFDEPENLVLLAELFINNAPELIEAACGVDAKDIKRLPLAAAADLIRALLEANLESQESLIKNFKALGEMIRVKMDEPNQEVTETE